MSQFYKKQPNLAGERLDGICERVTAEGDIFPVLEDAYHPEDVHWVDFLIYWARRGIEGES